VLLDENLSSVLLATFGEGYPGKVHVRDLGMKSASDTVVRAWLQNQSHKLCCWAVALQTVRQVTLLRFCHFCEAWKGCLPQILDNKASVHCAIRLSENSTKSVPLF
jgi:hypothetical protein